MENLGFKNLTEDNWLETDEASTFFVSISPDGQSHPVRGEEWLQLVLKPRLVETVPIEVRQLFEVARGAMAYGYLFYPIYTLAIEQVFRVAESAVSHKCKALGAPRSTKNFEKRIDWLVDNSAILESEREKWRMIRWFRNYTSHPETQMILPPGNAISMLGDIAQRINLLFNDGG